MGSHKFDGCITQRQVHHRAFRTRVPVFEEYKSFTNLAVTQGSFNHTISIRRRSPDHVHPQVFRISEEEEGDIHENNEHLASLVCSLAPPVHFNREIISPIMPLATTQHETTSVRLSMNKEWLMEHDYEWYTPPQMATDRPFPGQWVIGTKTSSMRDHCGHECCFVDDRMTTSTESTPDLLTLMAIIHRPIEEEGEDSAD